MERVWRWCRRNKAVAKLLDSTAALLLLITIGSLVALVLYREQREEARAGRRQTEPAMEDALTDCGESFLTEHSSKGDL